MIKMNCQECGYVRFATKETDKRTYTECDRCHHKFTPEQKSDWGILKSIKPQMARSGVTFLLYILGWAEIGCGIIIGIFLGISMGYNEYTYSSQFDFGWFLGGVLVGVFSGALLLGFSKFLEYQYRIFHQLHILREFNEFQLFNELSEVGKQCDINVG